MKRHQHVTKLQSELIQEKKFIDCKLDEAIAKHCYLKKSKYELMPQVVIPKIPSHLKCTQCDKIPNTMQHTVPMTPPNTPSKATLHNIITKRTVSTTQQGNFHRMSKQVVMYKFQMKYINAELLTADCD